MQTTHIEPSCGQKLLKLIVSSVIETCCTRCNLKRVAVVINQKGEYNLVLYYTYRNCTILEHDIECINNKVNLHDHYSSWSGCVSIQSNLVIQHTSSKAYCWLAKISVNDDTCIIIVTGIHLNKLRYFWQMLAHSSRAASRLWTYTCILLTTLCMYAICVSEHYLAWSRDV